MTADAPDWTPNGRRWWQYIGPWPLRPWVVALAVGAAVFVVNSAAWRQTLRADIPRVVGQDLVLAATGAFVVGGAIAVALRLFWARASRRVGVDLVILAVAAGITALSLGVVEAAFGSEGALAPLDLAQRALRIWVMAVVASAIAGVAEERLSHQTRIAERSLSDLREQQALMLIHEEKSRRQFAMLLHDRVQAGLMTACLELRAASQGPEVNRSLIDDAISRIDDLRGLDVHQAARSLSPDLPTIGLKGSLEELVRTYGSGFQSSIEVAPEISQGKVVVASNTMLACYRIIEQAVLNSVVHGQATTCTIAVAPVEGDRIEIVVADNGTGSSGAAVAPGFGSAVLDSWCRLLDGTWDLHFPESGGALLVAQLSLEAGATVDLINEGMSLQ